MLASAKYIDEIIENLNLLRSEITTRAKQGLTDLNKHCENFFCHILNIVYDYNLVNLNDTKENYPGIDLGDNEKRIAYQITSEKTSDKVNDTLTKFIKYEHYKTFDKLKILILTNKRSSYTVKTQINGLFSFDYKGDIVDLDDLIRSISSLDVFKLEELNKYFQAEFKNIHQSLFKEIANNILAKYTPEQRANEHIEILYVPQRAPTIHHGFIQREKKLELLHSILNQKPVLFIHGVTRSSKTFLVSQYISTNDIKQYYWYDFKVNQAFGDEQLYRDISLFLASKLSKPNIVQNWTNINTLGSLMADEIISKSIDLIVLDNIHCVSSIERVLSFLEIIYNKANSKAFVILISEDRDTLSSSAILIHNINSFEINGFDEDEILAYMKENGCDVDGIDNNLLSIIKSNTLSGHPDALNGLISEIKVNKGKKEAFNIVLEKIISGWKKDAQSKRIADVISHRIYNIQLVTQDEKRAFTRISALTDLFSVELAELLGNLSPKVNDFGITFNVIRNKLLDVHPNEKYSVPTIYKESAESHLTPTEKHDIYATAANFLFTPHNRIINFDDAVQSIFYCVMAGEIEEALRRSGAILSRMIIEGKDQSTLKYVLRRLDIFLNLNIETQYNNQYLPVCVMALKGYHEINDVQGQERMLRKMLSMPDTSLNDVSLFFREVNLVYHYSQPPENINLVVEHTLKVTTIISKREIPPLLKEPSFIHGLLKVSFFLIVWQEKPDIKSLLALIEAYIEAGIKLNVVFESQELSDFFQVMYTRLYKYFIADESRKSEIEDTIICLEELSSNFQHDGHLSAQRDIRYMIGCLLNDLSKDTKRTLENFKLAKDIHQVDHLDENKQLAEIHVGIADCYYKIKIYEEARNNYHKAIEIFNRTSSLDYLLFHSNRRMAICNAELNHSEDAEKGFYSALSIVRKLAIKGKQNIFETLGDLSTFYIKTNDYKKATKCFSIMIGLFDDKELNEYQQITAHCLGWLFLTLDGDWDGKLVNPDGTKSQEDHVKPYFGIYNTRINSKKPNLSLDNIKILHAVLLAQVGLADRSIISFVQLFVSNVAQPIDKLLLIGMFMKTQPLLKSVNNKKCLINCIVEQIRIIGNIDQTALPDALKGENYLNGIVSIEILPITSGLVIKYDNQISFDKAEENLLYFLARCDDLTNAKRQLRALLMGTLGWLYGYNQHLQRDYQGRAAHWLYESTNLAKDVNYIYVIINNRIFFDFVLISQARDVKKYARRNFETYWLIIANWRETQIFAETFSSNFIRVWSNIETVSTGMLVEDDNIIKTIQNCIKDMNYDSLVLSDRFVLIANIFSKISSECKIESHKLKIVMEYAFYNITERTKILLPGLLDNYVEVSKHTIISNYENLTFVDKMNKESINALNELKDRNWLLNDQEIQNRIFVISKALNALSGKI